MKDGETHMIKLSGNVVKSDDMRFFVDSKLQFYSTLHVIIETLLNQQYEALPVNGKTVVDIGANIGGYRDLFPQERSETHLCF